MDNPFSRSIDDWKATISFTDLLVLNDIYLRGDEWFEAPYWCPAFKDKTAPILRHIRRLHHLAILPYYYQSYKNESQCLQRPCLCFAITNDGLLSTIIRELQRDSKLSVYGARLHPHQVVASFRFDTNRLAVSQSRICSGMEWTTDIVLAPYIGSTNAFFNLNTMERAYIFDVVGSSWNIDVDVIETIYVTALQYWDRERIRDMALLLPTSRPRLLELPTELIHEIAKSLPLEYQHNLRVSCKAMNKRIGVERLYREFNVKVLRNGLKSANRRLVQHGNVAASYVQTLTLHFYPNSVKDVEFFGADILNQLTKSFPNCRYINLIHEGAIQDEDLELLITGQWTENFIVNLDIPESTLLYSPLFQSSKFSSLTLRCLDSLLPLKQMHNLSAGLTKAAASVKELRIVNSYPRRDSLAWLPGDVLGLLKNLSSRSLVSLCICGFRLTLEEAQQACPKKDIDIVILKYATEELKRTYFHGYPDRPRQSLLWFDWLERYHLNPPKAPRSSKSIW